MPPSVMASDRQKTKLKPRRYMICRATKFLFSMFLMMKNFKSKIGLCSKTSSTTYLYQLAGDSWKLELMWGFELATRLTAGFSCAADDDSTQGCESWLVTWITRQPNRVEHKSFKVLQDPVLELIYRNLVKLARPYSHTKVVIYLMQSAILQFIEVNCLQFCP